MDKKITLLDLKLLNASAYGKLPSKLAPATFYVCDGLLIKAVLEVGGTYVWSGRKWTKQ